MDFELQEGEGETQETVDGQAAEQPDEEIEDENDPEVIIPSLPNPITPLREPYSWHSPLPTAPGPYILGVDEAGRGPVLGPLVYGIAYCAENWQDELEGMGFAGTCSFVISKKTHIIGKTRKL